MPETIQEIPAESVRITTFRVTRWASGNIPEELDKVDEKTLALGQAHLVDKQAVIRIDALIGVPAPSPDEAQGTPGSATGGWDPEAVRKIITDTLARYDKTSVNVLRQVSAHLDGENAYLKNPALMTLTREKCLERLLLAELATL